VRQVVARTREAPDGVVLALACVAQFMVVLDVSIVNVALPSVGRDLHYSASGLQWVVNAYVLTFALTIITTTFTERERRTRAIGTWSAVAGAGGAAGAILGGVLTAELSWRWVLFVNLPIGIITAALAAVYLTELRQPAGDDARARIDIGGAVTITAGLGVLVYAIIQTSAHPWGSARTLVTLVVSAVLLVAFVVIEQRLATAPLVSFRLLRSRSVAGANIVVLLVGAAFFAMWYFLSLYFQDVLGYSALRAGLAFIPMALAFQSPSHATAETPSCVV
jgi:MFS family permease